jgi:hypothetical protein
VAGFNTANQGIYYENCVLDNTANKTFNFWTQLNYFRNITFAGTNAVGLGEKNQAMIIGCIQASTGAPGQDYQPKVVIGCVLPNWLVKRDSLSGGGDHGRFVYNNRLNTIRFHNASANTF